MKKIPKELQPILWSTNIKNLDPEKDKNYIIHQVLMYGTLKQIKWLFRMYGKETIKQTFLKEPQSIYSPPVLFFIKNIIFDLKNVRINKKEYVKTLF